MLAYCIRKLQEEVVVIFLVNRNLYQNVFNPVVQPARMLAGCVSSD